MQLLFQQTQNICITFLQCWTNAEDVGPALYKCSNILCLLRHAMSAESKLINPSMQSVCTLFDEHDQMYSMSVMCHIFYAYAFRG